MADEVKEYRPIETLELFHQTLAPFRCVVGPVGSGKTSAAAWEICYYLPSFLYQEYGITKTRWVVVRNTYRELVDTTQRTIFEWFPFGHHKIKDEQYDIDFGSFQVELLFRACDRPDHIKKFKSLDLTGYLIDESIEIAEQIKNMLKNRIGRYPKFEEWAKSMVKTEKWGKYTVAKLKDYMQSHPAEFSTMFGVEITNPPDVEHPTYYQFKWHAPPPGPIPTKQPLKGHYGFWQPEGENNANLRPGYYDDLRDFYRENPDWVNIYIEGKPGVRVQGKLVYHNFKRDVHVADEPLTYSGGPLYIGWDNTGNSPAAVVVQVPSPLRAQIMAEYYADTMGIIDFTYYIISQLNIMFPGYKELQNYGDPAGENRFSKPGGGLTSNAELQKEHCGIDVHPSEQNFRARVESVDQMLARVNGILIDPRCIRLINGFLGGYCYPENKTIVGEYMEHVLKNKYSHVHDALQYVMVKLFKPPKREDLTPGYKRKPQDNNYDPLRWGLS